MNELNDLFLFEKIVMICVLLLLYSDGVGLADELYSRKELLKEE